MAITNRMRSTVTARITGQNQISVPKAIRDHLDVGPGDDLEFEGRPDGSAIIRRRDRRSVLDLAGIAGPAAGRVPDGPRASKRMIGRGIAEQVAAKAGKIARQRDR